MAGSKPNPRTPKDTAPPVRAGKGAETLFGSAGQSSRRSGGREGAKEYTPSSAKERTGAGKGDAPKEPRLWICRLAVVEELAPAGQTIREIQFRRGLNIIATDEATDADARPVGHSVGKTLLIRLIRYCLGDPSFCTRTTRAAITENWEHGYVLAHFRVDGEDWVVARPIGLDAGSTSSFSCATASMESVRTDNSERQRYSAFAERLESLVAGSFADFELPHLDRQDRRALWTDYMGWLIRDQHCRYRHAAEWRDPDIDAGVASLHKEDAALLIQMALGLFDADRKKLATAHQALLADRSANERERASLEAFVARAGTLVPDAAADVSIPLLAESLKAKAERDIDGLRALQKDLDDPTEVRHAQDYLRQRIEARTKAEDQVATLTTTLQAAETQLSQLEAADANQAYQMFALMGAQYCPLFATKQEADNGGCPGRGVPLTVGTKDPQHLRKISETDQTIKRLRTEIAEATGTVGTLRDEESRASAALASAQEGYRDKVRGVAASIGRAEERLRQAASLRATWDGLERISGRIAALDRQVAESLERQQTVRSSLERRQKSLSARFDAILKTLLGPEASGRIAIDGRGIRPEVGSGIAVGGEAMSTSATVLGFDLATLLEPDDSAGCVLGFLCHDSPREADMEPPIYHRLFRLVRNSEPNNGAAGCQYIVTTTSPPPIELRAPYVVVTLSARSQDQLLLRRRF